jgi:hypothetical protein
MPVALTAAVSIASAQSGKIATSDIILLSKTFTPDLYICSIIVLVI